MARRKEDGAPMPEACAGCGAFHGTRFCLKESFWKHSVAGVLPAARLFANGVFVAHYRFHGPEQEDAVKGAVAILNMELDNVRAAPRREGQ